MLDWTWKLFSQLSVAELYSLLTLRAEVFVVEQNCPYLDPDGRDLRASHLLGCKGDVLLAYLRLVAPGDRYPEPSIGRVVIAREARRLGLGQAMMKMAVEQCQRLYPGLAVSLSAQTYLHDFYAAFGFCAQGRSYMEDGLPHIHMLRQPI